MRQNSAVNHFSTRNLIVICAVILLSGALSAASAQTFTSLAYLNGTDGLNPSALVQGTDGNFYGTTARGGSSGQGTVIKVTSAGAISAIYNFCSLPSCADGLQPQGSLALGGDGNFYGTAAGGGAQQKGTVFKITPGGTLTTLYSFCAQTNCTDGAIPFGGLVLESDGNFYGTTAGVTSITNGTIYRITPAGTLTTLYNFCSKTDCADGTTSRTSLARDRGETLYGTTPDGGTTGSGTVFRITMDGKFFKTLHSFCTGGAGCPDGSFPMGPLTLGYDGNIYGTAGSGGANSNGAAFSLTPSGGYALLYSFCPVSTCLDGTSPQSGLFQATNGKFYGTAVEGGYNGRGVFFQVTTAGAETRLHSFHVSDGAAPNKQVVQGTDGNIYGTTSNGGPRNVALCEQSGPPFGCGTVFSYSVGKPFVKPVQLEGAAGDSIIILGNGLTGSTGVTFNGTTAVFSVVSDTEITATVPSGATTGIIQVLAPGGTLVSNIKFEVLPSSGT